jgi:hypothetical protein
MTPAVVFQYPGASFRRSEEPQVMLEKVQNSHHPRHVEEATGLQDVLY